MHPFTAGQVTVIAMAKRAGLHRLWPPQRQRRCRASSVSAVGPEATNAEATEMQERETEEPEEEEDESMAEVFEEEAQLIAANLDLFLRAEAMGPLSHTLDPEVRGSTEGASSSSHVPAPQAPASEVVEPENTANVSLEISEGG